MDINVQISGATKEGVQSATRSVSAGITGAVVTGINQGVELLKKIGTFIKSSSPYLAGMLDLTKKAFGMFFRPMGDFLGTLLRPLAVWLMRMAYNFMLWFKDAPSVFKTLLTAGSLAALITAGIKLGDLTGFGGIGDKLAKATGFTFGKGMLIIGAALSLIDMISQFKAGNTTKALQDLLMAGGQLAIVAGGPVGWAIGLTLIATSMLLDPAVQTFLSNLAVKINDMFNIPQDSMRGGVVKDVMTGGVPKMIYGLGKKAVNGLKGEEEKVTPYGTGMEDYGKKYGEGIVDVNKNVSGSESTWNNFSTWIQKAYDSTKTLIMGETGLQPFGNLISVVFPEQSKTFNTAISEMIKSLNNEKASVDALTASYEKLNKAKTGKSSSSGGTLSRVTSYFTG